MGWKHAPLWKIENVEETAHGLEVTFTRHHHIDSEVLERQTGIFTKWAKRKDDRELGTPGETP
jgi:hypothetical protein